MRQMSGIERLPLLDALALSPERWDDLVSCSPLPSPFMRWAWHAAWTRAAAPEEVASSFALVLNDSAGRAQGIVPLCPRAVSFRRTRARAVTWAAGSVGCPDHLDIPAAPGADLASLVPGLEGIPWDVLVLSGVADGAPNVRQLVDAFDRRGYAVRHAEVDMCPYVDLPASWDEYLATLSSSRRQMVRRKERKLLRDHAGTITDYAPNRIDEGWSLLRALHEARWGGPGALGEPMVDRLLREFAGELATRGELWLTSLDLDGKPAAAWCGFAWRDTVYFYQSGRDPEWEHESIGQVLLGAMIRRAIERGFKHFDLLRGRDAYKFSWTGASRPIHEVVVFRPGWSGARLRALDLVGRARARIRSRPEFAVSDA
jgi:CelD/BcsL family acetyltransferase involved in cellulose biosynthesis